MRIGAGIFGLGFLEAGVLLKRQRGVGGGDVPFVCSFEDGDYWEVMVCNIFVYAGG